MDSVNDCRPSNGARVCKLRTFEDTELADSLDGEPYENLRTAMDFGWRLLGPPRFDADTNSWTWYLQR